MTQIMLGDCLDQLKELDDNSIDSIVTDPPYGLSFMGKAWDYDVPTQAIWKECLRVLKPGGHLLAFGGTRTYHRLVVNIEDAGFEIRDQIMWIYGSGFPKSQNIALAIDKQLGVESINLGADPNQAGRKKNKGRVSGTEGSYEDETEEREAFIKEPASEVAKKWSGYGTALKPANEPICLARKPLSEKTVAKNVLKHGVGGLNVDGSRIGSEVRTNQPASSLGNAKTMSGGAANPDQEGTTVAGRFPANILFDEYAAGVLDEQSGTLKSGAWNGVTNKARGPQSKGAETERVREDRAADSGGASRFFKVIEQDFEPEEVQDSCVYRSRKERKPQDTQKSDAGGASRFFYVAKASKRDRGEGNVHPTVKPIKLMEYLVKLVTPEGGIVLDPFMGSGTTGVAALGLGFKFVGIERDDKYFEICEQRIRDTLAARKLAKAALNNKAVV